MPITQRRMGELVRGVFAILLERGEPVQASEVLKALEERVPPTTFEEDTYASKPNVRRYEKVVRFASIAAVKAGWLVKDKGQWSVTDEGRQAFEKFTDPEAFKREANKLYRVWKAQQEPSDEDDGDDQAARTGFEEAEEAAWPEIREYLVKMPPYEFQRLVASLLEAMGYHVLWVAPPGPDRGIDIIAHNDPLGTTSPRIKVQVKRQADTKISAEGLRSFMAVLGDQDVGIYISAGGFTSEAEREARSQERRRLTLIDLNRLVELWIEYFDQLDETDRQRLPLKPIYFLAPQ